MASKRNYKIDGRNYEDTLIKVLSVSSDKDDGTNKIGDNIAIKIKYSASIIVQDNNSGLVWSSQLGTSRDDVILDLVTDPLGNSFVTGFTYGTWDGNSAAGSTDMLLIKYNSSGAKQWSQQLGTASDESGSGVAVDEDGNTYVTGYTTGGIEGNKWLGDYDIFLVKYNSNGIKQWVKQFGTSKKDESMSLGLDKQGNIYIAGHTHGGLDGNTNSGNNDFILVKFNSSETSSGLVNLGLQKWTTPPLSL